MCSFSYSIWLVFRDLKHQTSSTTSLDLGCSGHGAGQWWAGGERGHGASPGGSGTDVVGIVAEGRGENLLECGQPNAINIHKPTIWDGWYNPWWFWWFMDVYGIGFTMVYHIEIWCMQGAWPSMHGTALFASVARMNHSCCSSASDPLPSHWPTIEVGHVRIMSAKKKGFRKPRKTMNGLWMFNYWVYQL